MRLKDRSEFFRNLVRAADLAAAVEEQALVKWQGLCETHGDTDHWVNEKEEGACCLCVDRSRILAEIGRAGGRKGGANMTPRKAKAFRRNARKRWAGR